MEREYVMKALKTFFLCSKDCFDVFRIRRIESSLLERSLLSDLKLLLLDLLLVPKRFLSYMARQKSFRDPPSRPLYGASGAGRTRYQITPSFSSGGTSCPSEDV